MWQVSLSRITLATSIYGHIRQELDSMPEMHPIVITRCSFLHEGSQSLAESGQIPIYKELNKSFKLQYYIPVCCLFLCMDCGYKCIIKVVPDVYHRYFFGVKVKTVKFVTGRRFLAVRSGLNVRTYCGMPGSSCLS